MQAFETTTVPAPKTKVGDLVGLIRTEYTEMPGLGLTRAKVPRLWLLEPAACDHALRALVDTGYVRLTPGGYKRR